ALAPALISRVPRGHTQSLPFSTPPAQETFGGVGSLTFATQRKALAPALTSLVPRGQTQSLPLSVPPAQEIFGPVVLGGSATKPGRFGSGTLMGPSPRGTSAKLPAQWMVMSFQGVEGANVPPMISAMYWA